MVWRITLLHICFPSSARPRNPSSILLPAFLGAFLVSVQLFARSMQQFDRIRKRNAFVDNYRKEPMFADNLDEFEHSRYVLGFFHQTMGFNAMVSGHVPQLWCCSSARFCNVVRCINMESHARLLRFEAIREQVLVADLTALSSEGQGL